MHKKDHRTRFSLFSSAIRPFAIAAILVLGVASGLAQRGAAAPWTTYEAENMTISGGTILGVGGSGSSGYGQNTVQSESSGRACVQLNATGQYVQFTNQAAANSLIVRYSVPDTSGGGGANYTLSLYINGTLIGELPVTSMYSWLYGADPFTNNPSAGSPRNFYDEVRTNGLTINPGDVVRIEKGSSDTASFYDIDLVDLENVAAPLAQPANSLSITSYGADSTGASDSTAALENCITAALNEDETVFIPAGTYLISSTINLPSNVTIQGAGMWHSTLVGNPSLYQYPGNRITFNGEGSNIHLSDFAIIGKLNYRNNNEPNDGLGGSYGTGSTISRLWVEHTKTGAWIVNSQGLVINGCRFRNTIADGCNLDVGMQSTIVTNCTTRGTGDDCFAIWPATYLTPTYTPGENVFNHCTAQLSWLANGGTVYGGDNNTIENCLFQDMTYDCGILISTAFYSGGTPITGITAAQNCDMIRCGGTAGLEICMASANLSNIQLSSLNITNSGSYGMSIIGYGSTSTLSSSWMSNVNIPNYALGGSGNGLWAENTVSGSITVSNSVISQTLDSSGSFTFNVVNTTISATVNTSPSGLNISVDGTSYTSPQTFNWTPGSNHTIATTATQSGATGTQYIWNSWSDGGALSHTVAPTTGTGYTANFTTQYYLTMNAGANGSVSPASGWTNSGAAVNISATPASGYDLTDWSGVGSGAYSGTNDPVSITMNGPITETATFGSNVQPPPVQTLSFAQQPVNTLQGAVITPEVQVQAFGTNGLVLAGTSINVALTNGTGTLAGTLTRTTDSSGVAHFNDLSINLAGPKTLTATAAVGNPTPAISNPFMIIGPVAGLAFTTQPGSATAGVPFAQQPVLKTVDQFGTPTTTGLPTSLPGLVTLTNGSGTLSGTTSFDLGTSASNGVVTFNNLAISAPGTGNQLVASTSATAGSPVAGAVLWLDAADPTTLTTNATQVVAWKNKGSGGAGTTGTNLWFTQYTTALQPWLTNQLNGKPVVTFNKNGSEYSAGCTFLGNTNQFSYTNGGSQMSYFIVARQSEDSIGWQGPVSFSASGQKDGSDTAGVVVLADGTGSAPYPFGIQRNHPATPMQADIAAPSVNTAFLMAFVDNAGTATLSLTNGSGLFESNSANIVNGISPYDYGITGATVGGRLEPDPTTVDNGWDGDVAEVLVYNTALSAANQASVESYLMNKWFAIGGGSSLSNALSQPFAVSASGGPSPKSITRVTVNAGGSVTIAYATSQGYTYHVESTPSLAPATWTTVAGSTTNSPGDVITFTDPNTLGGGQRYYRAVSP